MRAGGTPNADQPRSAVPPDVAPARQRWIDFLARLGCTCFVLILWRAVAVAASLLAASCHLVSGGDDLAVECDYCGDCQNCADCAFEGPCAAELEACQDSEPCVGLWDCLHNGGADCDDDCIDKCVDRHGDGVAAYKPVSKCWLCNQCRSDCGPVAGCE